MAIVCKGMRLHNHASYLQHDFPLTSWHSQIPWSPVSTDHLFPHRYDCCCLTFKELLEIQYGLFLSRSATHSTGSKDYRPQPTAVYAVQECLSIGCTEFTSKAVQWRVSAPSHLPSTAIHWSWQKSLHMNGSFLSFLYSTICSEMIMPSLSSLKLL